MIVHIGRRDIKCTMRKQKVVRGEEWDEEAEERQNR